MEALFPYLLTGVVSGVLAGLLGIGGGLVIVPALAFLLEFDSTHIMHIAIGTSFSVVTLTAMSSARAHHMRGTVRWGLWRRLAPGLAIGTLFGVTLANELEGDTLRLFFAIFEILVAAQLMFGGQPKPVLLLPNTKIILCLSVLIGIICAFAGVGGGIMLVPLMIWMGLSMKESVSTSAACGIPIAIAGTVGFILVGLDVSAKLPAMSLGYIYWPAFFSIAIPSILFAPLGAKIAHALPTEVLTKVFSVFLLLLALIMFFE